MGCLGIQFNPEIHFVSEADNVAYTNKLQSWYFAKWYFITFTQKYALIN